MRKIRVLERVTHSRPANRIRLHAPAPRRAGTGRAAVRWGAWMSHGRKYGEKESRPVPIWNGIFEHYERIGDGLWEFEKCIDWITEERDGVGIVLGGKPIKVSEIVAAIKGSKKET